MHNCTAMNGRIFSLLSSMDTDESRCLANCRTNWATNRPTHNVRKAIPKTNSLWNNLDVQNVPDIWVVVAISNGKSATGWKQKSWIICDTTQWNPFEYTASSSAAHAIQSEEILFSQRFSSSKKKRKRANIRLRIQFHNVQMYNYSFARLRDYLHCFSVHFFTVLPP